jgi:hypothetical protein
MADAARALARSLLASGWSDVTVDPYTWNQRAVRAWRKAGFEPVEERLPDGEHSSRWLLMRFQEKKTSRLSELYLRRPQADSAAGAVSRCARARTRGCVAF